MLYSKIIIWLDLAITSDKYEAEKVVKLFELIKETEAKQHVPTKLAFEPIEEDFIGFYQKEPSAPCETMHTQMALLDAYYEMEELVKKSFLYTEEKIEQFKENNVEQQTLRQIVEEQSIQLI
jgi:hypothetical protein